MVRIVAPERVAARSSLPRLSARHLSRLPESLRIAHARLIHNSARASIDPTRHRAQQLALSLVKMGEDVEETTRQLAHWGFEAGVARAGAVWAVRVLATMPPTRSTAPREELEPIIGIEPERASNRLLPAFTAGTDVADLAGAHVPR
jgi:hypothetical protein